ncbi:hypothetical protein So717_12770 [Roseobacter cerasinus]|uniref:Uncharacterized protein n=1 Tax=Roseobacter cerasinus TaxID=2602289 RepID=A0A640VPI0_9RHOB|nr:hypothetical protein [Roseobacter cerasinus]GFE49524.1 hypothetical protein So717_12770 [Roseobacter cerasinus]
MRSAPVPISFQTLQVVADLRAVVVAGADGLAAHLAAEKEPLLRRVIDDQGCLLSAEDAEALREDLLLVAARPDQGLADFLAATALLLADRLQGGAGADDLYWNWDAFAGHYRKGPAPVRAAVLHGFRLAHATRRVNLEHPPEGRGLYTYDAADLQRFLTLVARSLSPVQRDHVCRSAPADTRAVHRTALDNCLDGSCRLSDYGTWFPREVVEMVSLQPEHVGFAPATALLLLDCIATRDAEGRMAFRWAELAPHYVQMTSKARGAILAGVRHLYETSPDWAPYAGWAPDRLVEKAVVVPFAKA